MSTELTYLSESPSQTAGPYVVLGLAPSQGGLDIFDNEFSNTLFHWAPGRIRVEGRILDGSGTPVRDALIEIWQADPSGEYGVDKDAGAARQPSGWGRACTDFSSGVYRFDTVKPGPVRGRHGRMMAPHINFWVVARGINVGLHTRMYFGDERANAEDPILNGIEWEVRRKTLIAQRSEGDGVAVYRFDIVLQGVDETVFFDL
jgi:protocatechuate 3,4-dioxygenase alpha subunit